MPQRWKTSYIVQPSALPPALLDGLSIYFKSLDAHNLKMAGIGRDFNHQVNRFVRGDRVAWLESGHPDR